MAKILQTDVALPMETTTGRQVAPHRISGRRSGSRTGPWRCPRLSRMARKSPRTWIPINPGIGAPAAMRAHGAQQAQFVVGVAIDPAPFEDPIATSKRTRLPCESTALVTACRAGLTVKPPLHASGGERIKLNRRIRRTDRLMARGRPVAYPPTGL